MSREDLVTPSGLALAEARRQRGWTQEQLAFKAGYSKSTVERIERGLGTQRETLSTLAETLGIHVGELMSKSESPMEAGRTCVLPPFPPLFVGRDSVLRELKDRLGFSDSARRQRTVVVRGWPGMGKTTLSAVLAHEAIQTFPVVLWTSLGQSFSPESQLATWCRAICREVLSISRTVRVTIADNLQGGNRCQERRDCLRVTFVVALRANSRRRLCEC